MIETTDKEKNIQLTLVRNQRDSNQHSTNKTTTRWRKLAEHCFITLFSIVCIHSCETTSEKLANQAPPKSIILFLSDSPVMTHRLSKNLIGRLNNEKIFSIQENKAIINDLIKDKSSVDSKKNKASLLSLANEIKDLYHTRPLGEAKAKSQSVIHEAQKILSQTHISLASEYAALAFWSAVVNFNDPQNFKFPTALYLNLATKKEKKLLEEQVSPKIIALMHSYPVDAHSIRLTGYNSCKVFVNGKQQRKSFIVALAGGNNVISADCSTGVYSNIFDPKNTEILNILPTAKTPLSQFSFTQTMYEKLEKAQIDSAIMFSTSNRGKHINTDVYDIHTKKICDSYSVTTNGRRHLKNTENLLINFLKNASDKIKMSLLDLEK